VAAAEDTASVIVVDDDPRIRAACEDALTRAGFEVTVVSNGTEAIAAREQRRFDAAVFDIVLPDIDGVELLRRSREISGEIVVVLMTGFASLDTAMEAVRLGAYEYLRKPFGAWDLVRVIRRGIESTRLKDQNTALLAELQRANAERVENHERLAEKARSASEDITAFVELGQRMGEGGDLEETLSTILSAGAQIARARSGAIYASESDPPCLRGLIAQNLPERYICGVELPLSEGLLGRAASTGDPQMENDLLAEAIAGDRHLGYLGVQSVLACPLRWDGAVHGVMALFDSTEGGFSEERLHLLQLLSGQAARIVATMERRRREQPSQTVGPEEFVDLADFL